MHIPSITLAAATVFLAAAPAIAQNDPVVVEGGLPTASVSYADLNIASPAGRHTLEGRVERAASALCLENQRVPIKDFMSGRHCFSLAMSKARIDIDLAAARAAPQLASERTIKVAVK